MLQANGAVQDMNKVVALNSGNLKLNGGDDVTRRVETLRCCEQHTRRSRVDTLCNSHEWFKLSLTVTFAVE